jgi:hypothetical protein
MRTTVDLDPDLLERLRVESARRRVSFKDLLNRALRAGLAAPEHRRPRPYAMPTFRLGRVREGVDLDRALDVAHHLEADEVARKLARRK